MVLAFFLLNVTKSVVFHCRLAEAAHHPGYLVLYLLQSLLVLGSVWALLFSVRSKVPLVLFYVAQFLFLDVNTTYFRFFEYYLTLHAAAQYVDQLFPLLGYVSIYFDVSNMVYLMDLPAFVLLVVRLRFPILDPGGFRFRIVAALATVGVVVAMSGLFHAAHLHFLHRTPDHELRDIRLVRDLGLLPFIMLDSFQDLTVEHDLMHLSYLKVSNRKVEFPKAVQKSNIILLQVEALDAEAVRARHHGKPVMPYLDALREQCIHYPYVLAYHGAGGSSEDEFVLLNSIEPLQRSVYFRQDYLFPNSIIKIFNGAGYKTLAFHGNAATCWNRGPAFARMGYSRFYDLKATGLKEVGWGAPDKEFLDYVRSFLSRVDHPFFAHVITMSSHYPYTLVNRYFRDSSFDDIGDTMVRNYFTAARYTDQAIRDFVEDARKRPHTYIFIYGDHGCTASGREFHCSKHIVGNHTMEFVPLFILTPDGQKYRETKCVASFLDLAPTILAASGCGCVYATRGQNLLEYPLKSSNVPFHGLMLSREKLWSQYVRNRGGE